MKNLSIDVVSDLHIHEKKHLPKLKKNSDILIIAGDVCSVINPVLIDFFSSLNYDHVLYIPGNHEYYASNWYTTVSKLKNILLQFPNVHLLNDEIITIENITFLGSTLWTDCNKKNPNTMFYVKQYLNDYNFIFKKNDITITPEDTIKQHSKSLKFIKKNIKKVDVIITHHAPASPSIPHKYKHSNINGGFYSDLSNLILDNKINCWIHGHVHDPCDYSLGTTRIIAHPRGYENENNFYKKYNVKTIKI